MMTRRLWAGVAGLAVVAALAAAHFSSNNTEPTAAGEQRLISTAPSITEMLYALGLGDQIVAVDRFSRHPAEAMEKTKIGDYAAPNLEVIASLKPTLVLIPVNPVQLRERLETMQLKVLELDQEMLPSMFASFEVVGKATGTEARAKELVEELRARLDVVRAQSKGLPKTRMMFVVGRSPNRLDGLIVVGSGSYLNELIEMAGGENVFRDAAQGYPRVSLEEVLSRNPDVIVDMGDMADTVAVSDEKKESVRQLWQRMSSIDAVRTGRVHAVASDIYVVPGARAVDAAEAFFEMLHPEVVQHLREEAPAASGTTGGAR